jgi:hypothetical protein
MKLNWLVMAIILTVIAAYYAGMMVYCYAWRPG